MQCDIFETKKKKKFQLWGVGGPICSKKSCLFTCIFEENNLIITQSLLRCIPWLKPSFSNTNKNTSHNNNQKFKWIMLITKSNCSKWMYSVISCQINCKYNNNKITISGHNGKKSSKIQHIQKFSGYPIHLSHSLSQKYLKMRSAKLLSKLLYGKATIMPRLSYLDNIV